MNRIATPADIKRLGAILSVWAHPDDESLLAGGIMAAAVQNGQEVICVTATKGEAGVQDETRWPAAQLGEIRSKELQAALKELGITRHYWLGYHDGECGNADAGEAVQKIAGFIEQYRPDSILTFGPEGLTGHPDHQAVSRWAAEASKRLQAKPRVYHAVFEPDQYEQFLKPLDEHINMFFNIAVPPLVPAEQCAVAFELPEAVLEQKWRALAAMPSQMERLLTFIPDNARKGTLGKESFVLVEP